MGLYDIAYDIGPVVKSQAISDEVGSADGNQGVVLSAISNRMVQLHKEHYGKGPTRARSYLMGDLVVCVMRGGFTRAEETLISSGRAKLVQEQRAQFQTALEGEFVGSIEEIVGRRVVAFMSNMHEDPPMIAEMFLLESEDDGVPVRR
jgi:uncharacterized protein YbcI